MANELIAAFDRADADDDVRAIIVTGAGRGLLRGRRPRGRRRHLRLPQARARPGPARDNGGEFTLRIFDCTKPVIAAINGPAVGVGATMTLPMDVRLAAEDARIGFVFARRGIIPEACSSWFLPRVVGISRAMEWVATGRVFSAQEALEGGLVRSLHPGRRAARRRACAGARDRREHGAGVGRARPPADVEDARRRAPDARPPRRLARAWSRAGSRRTRSRASPPSSRSVPARVPRPRQRRAARRHARLERARVRVAPPRLPSAGSSWTSESTGREQVAVLGHAREHLLRLERELRRRRRRCAPRAPPPSRAAWTRSGARWRAASTRTPSSSCASFWLQSISTLPVRRAFVMRETTSSGSSAASSSATAFANGFVCS